MKLKKINASERKQDSAARKYRNYLQQYAAQLEAHPERYESEVAEAEQLIESLRRTYGRKDCQHTFLLGNYPFSHQTYEN